MKIKYGFTKKENSDHLCTLRVKLLRKMNLIFTKMTLDQFFLFRYRSNTLKS